MRSRARDVVDSNGDWGREMCGLLFLYMHLRSKMLDDARMMLSKYFSLAGNGNQYERRGAVGGRIGFAGV